MLIDCDTCRMQNTDACADCVVGHLVDGGTSELADDEFRALRILAEEGMIPRLRLVPRDPPATRSA
ncbi:MAG: hypothetical protein KatS3mg011_1789 [Acidimicrobiia bacterium]|nr:MAG: hypothetical protein KatS3mg011_1789 [Acidimicrobiia bacterium]